MNTDGFNHLRSTDSFEWPFLSTLLIDAVGSPLASRTVECLSVGLVKSHMVEAVAENITCRAEIERLCSAVEDLEQRRSATIQKVTKSQGTELRI
jgi:hypothetical protein